MTRTHKVHYIHVERAPSDMITTVVVQLLFILMRPPVGMVKREGVTCV